MGKAFKLTLRTALILLIMVGLGLVLYASLSGNPRQAPARVSTTVQSTVQKMIAGIRDSVRSPQRPAAQPPSQRGSQRQGPEARPPAPVVQARQGPAPSQASDVAGSAAPKAAAGPQPAPQPPATQPPAAGANGSSKTAAQPQPGEHSPETEPGRARATQSAQEVQGFVAVLRDSTKEREQATIVGKRAVFREAFYDIFVPHIVVPLYAAQGQPVDAQLRKVHITADRAVLDDAHTTVQGFGNVTATGEDFEVKTESAVYQVNERTVTSDKPVRMQKDKVEKDGTRTVAMVVTGDGLNADLTLMNVTVLKNANAHLYGVSDNFLAAEMEKAPAGNPNREVVISSDGPMLYEHSARRVTFSNNVHAITEGRRLDCKQLVLQLSKADSGSHLEVSEMVGTGGVRMSYLDQVAQGEKLKWQSVIQTGVLTGEPATLTTPQFDLSGNELTFYRINDRFDVKGPGTLFWKGRQKDSPVPQEVAASPAPSMGPLRMSPDAPLHITWTSAMTYQATAHVATFQGQVVARQDESALECEHLVLSFDAGAGSIQKAEGEGQVGVHNDRTAGGQDVVSDKLLWDAEQNKVELMGRDGQIVNVERGQHAVASSHVIMDNSGQTLDCPAGGKLTVKPAKEKAAGSAAPEAPPIEVEWHKAMHFEQRPVQVANFAGQVTARRADQRIAGEALRAEFDDKMNPTKITATGNAAIELISTERAPLPSQKTARPAATESGKAPATVSLPGAGGGRWLLTSNQFDISVPDNLVTSSAPGTLSVMKGDATTGTVTWQKSTRLDMTNNTAFFEGDVNANFSGAILKGQKLTLEFDKAKKLRHIWADGNVYFTRQEKGSWELQGQSAEGVVAGENELQQVIARNNVEARDNTRVLNANVLQLFFEKAEATQQTVLDRAVAQEKVRLRYVQDERLDGAGDRLEWNRKTDTYVLTGVPDAIVRMGGLTVANDKIYVDRPTGKMDFPPGAHPVETRTMVREAPKNASGSPDGRAGAARRNP